MAKREFTYKGKTVSELLPLSQEDFAQLLPTRAKRSLLRGVNKRLNQRMDEADKLGKKDKEIRTHNRSAVITPRMVGRLFGVYSGNQFQKVEIMPEMLGHKLGELALTRKRLRHGKAGIGATKSSTAITAR